MFGQNKRGQTSYRGRGRGGSNQKEQFTKKINKIVKTTTDVNLDHKQLIENLQTFSSSYNFLSEQFVSDLKQYLLENIIQYKIRFIVEETINPKQIRIIFTTDRHGADFSIPLVRESNGMIISINNDLEIKLCVLPNNEFNNSYSAVDIEQFLRDDLYTVYTIQDGTTFNMYYSACENKWNYSTKNSSNISPIEWRGETYDKVISECFAEYPEFNLENLDKECCYTFGFKHPAHHPFIILDKSVSDKRVWLIQAYNTTQNVRCSLDIGIPHQQTIKLTDIVVNNDYIYGDLNLQCNNALKNYLQNKTNPLLGFILRSKDTSRTGQYSDILMESGLFQEIKKCIYDLPPIKNKLTRNRVKLSFKNMNYVIANACLDFSKSEIFFQLFPQYEHHQKRFNNILDMTVQKIINRMTQNLDERNIFQTTPDDEAASQIATQLLPLIRQRINTPDSQIIRNCIRNPKYTEIYCEHL